MAGINHGANLGDDITYSGTVAAALEGIMLGVPGIAVSQQSTRRELDFRLGHQFAFENAAAFVARVVDRLDDVPLPVGTLLNINVPTGEIGGVEVTRLGKRIYQDRLDLIDEDTGRKRYRVYGDSPVHDDEPGTDLAAVSAGNIAVTPLHFDLTAEHGMEALREFDLAQLLEADDVDPTFLRPAPPSCASSSTTTRTGTTSSTTRRSATTPTTRCWTSCARSRRRIPSC